MQSGQGVSPLEDNRVYRQDQSILYVRGILSSFSLLAAASPKRSVPTLAAISLREWDQKAVVDGVRGVVLSSCSIVGFAEAHMERPIFKPVGTPVAQLDTPALVVDLTLVEQNISTLHAFFEHGEAKVRPHVTAHRCPALAHKQLTAGGTVDGISVTTVGEAEVFADHGFDNICVANEVVTPQKIRRLCALARRASMIVAVDHPANVRDLSAAAEAHGVTLQVVVDLHTRLHR